MHACMHALGLLHRVYLSCGLLLRAAARPAAQSLLLEPKRLGACVMHLCPAWCLPTPSTQLVFGKVCSLQVPAFASHSRLLHLPVP